ncbi:MAG TPA: hypothetical protein VKT77_19950, partial [Chthonomonadaceae bacterium]|nr:hypothetical protein [Chthonomonadaceae bacterium]
GAIALFAWHVTSAVEPIHKIVSMVLIGGDGPPPQLRHGWQYLFQGAGPFDLVCQLATVAFAAAIPLLASMAFLIVSRAGRVPLSVALVRGFRGCAVAIASVIVLIYAATLPVTFRLERISDDGIRQSMRHEGRYLAEQGGSSWPGVVR